MTAFRLPNASMAELYGVEVKRINEAVNRNTDKFPEGFVIILNSSEKSYVVANCDRNSNALKMSRVLPAAFTEKGLYMLATILKSPTATQTTLAIVETFAKIREFAKIVSILPDIKDEQNENTLMQRGGDIFLDILEDNILEITGDEISFELDLKIMKLKRVIKRESKK